MAKLDLKDENKTWSAEKSSPGRGNSKGKGSGKSLGKSCLGPGAERRPLHVASEGESRAGGRNPGFVAW